MAMYGFYEQKPEPGTIFTTDADGVDIVEDIYNFDDSEGAWLVLAENSGTVLIKYQEDERYQVS